MLTCALSDKVKLAVFLNGLLPSYEEIRTSFTMCGEFTMSELYEVLKSKETRCGGANSSNDLMMAAGQPSGHRGRRGVCHNCGVNGHWVRDCQSPPGMSGQFNRGQFGGKRGRGSRGSRELKGTRTNNQQLHGVSNQDMITALSSEDVGVCVQLENSEAGHKLLINSGASKHMICDRVVQ